MKIFGKMLIILAGSVILGAMLLFFTFSLPNGAIRKNAENAGYVFAIESGYPYMDGKISKGLDNHTDAMMILNAFFEEEGATDMQRAMGIWRPSYNEHGCDIQLQLYLAGEEGYTGISYARYWHGYLIFLKPLMMMVDYLSFRDINRIIQGSLILAISILLWKKLSILYVIPFLSTIFFMRPDAVSFSMFYSSVYYVALFSTIGIILFHARLSKGNNYFYFFFIVGIITSYLDLLTYPVITLGIPLCIWLCFEKTYPCCKKIKHIVINSIGWGIGYAGMWIGKWVIGSLLLRENIIAIAWEAVRFRTSTSVETGGDKISRWNAIVRNFSVGFEDIPILVIMVIILLVLLVGLLRIKRDLKEFVRQSVPILLVGLIPIVWYIVLGNHSYVHSWFAYRTLSISVFAVMLIMTISPSTEE